MNSNNQYPTTMHKEAIKTIENLKAQGHTIKSVISCKSYTRVITDYSNVHIHH